MVLLDKSLIPTFGIPNLDNEHYQLVKIINEIYEGFLYRTHDELYDSLNKFMRATHNHFMAEERTMVAYKYPGTTTHAAAHAAFINIVKALRDATRTATMDDLRERLFSTLLPEFLRHTREQDASFRDFLSLRANDTYLGRSDER